MAYVSSYFAQGEEGAAALDQLDQLGAAAWLDQLAGALDFTEGEVSSAPPWGSSDRLAHEEAGAHGTTRVHVNWPLGYVGVTLEVDD